MNRVLQMLLDGDDPASVIGKVIEAGTRSEATAFEQYASLTLSKAGGYRLTGTRFAGTLKVIQPNNGRLAQLVHSAALPPSLETTVLATECTLNRLICIADAIADGKAEGEPRNDAPRRSISILGGGFLSTNVGWRSSRVILPDMAVLEGDALRYYNEVDWRLTDCVASNARAVFQHSLRPNPYRTLFGISSAPQSDWDVRTRLAQILGALELPYRYSFRFDYDDAEKAVVAAFTCPPIGFLPAPPDDGGNPSVARPRDEAYRCHLVRLACLFAAACFGGGRTIQTASVIGYNASWSKPLVSARFERDDFVRSVLVAIDNDEFQDHTLRFDPQSVAAMISASHLDWIGRTGESDASGIAVPESAFIVQHADPWNDVRPLDRDAQVLFHCERICDVDTSHYLGGHADAVDLARNDSDDSPIAAIARLEGLVDELEASLAAPADDASARPLYAVDPFSRLAIGLLDDDFTIADQAQAFLQGDMEALPNKGKLPRYFRAPNALYHAHFGLSCLYQELKDYTIAERHADRCISLAPTTAGAYYRKADVLAENGWYAQAANVLITGLRTSAVSADCALLYFHLGMLLWNLGEKSKAAAVHAYNASLQGEYAERSKKVIGALRERSDAPDEAHANPFAASHLLSQMNLPIAPVNLRTQIAQAAITLANSGSPKAAAPYARQLERQRNNDEIVIAACHSIQFGITL